MVFIKMQCVVARNKNLLKKQKAEGLLNMIGKIPIRGPL